LRERTRDDHDHKVSECCTGSDTFAYPNATYYGGLLRRRPLIAAAPFSDANTNSLLEIAGVLVPFDHVASGIVKANHGVM
jgi:hypothetical protein